MAANRTALALYTWDPYMHNPKLPGRMHRIKCPTLFLWGESDGLVSVDYGRAYSNMIAGARFQTIPGAGHMPYIEQPELFSQAVQAFTLASQTNASGEVV
jgi:pimeloyl-ACP methyl ester carboxylesterase